VALRLPRWNTAFVTETAKKTGRKPSKPLLVGLLILHCIMATLTWQDLKRRSDTEVRGKKSFWRAAALLNSSNSVLYFLVGRKPKQPAQA
jgi:hypothetical protein